MLPEPFAKELYVGREDFMRQILKWIDESRPSFRLRSIVGSAGSGKSWFIAYLYHKLKDKNPSIIVVWMNLSARPVHPVTKELEPVLHRLAGWQSWSALIPEQRFPSWADLGAKLGEFLKQKRNEYEKIVVLVDGFDEVPLEERGWIEEHVLAIAYENEKVRLVMTRRDQDALSHPILRWNDRLSELPGLTSDEGREQIILRHKYHAEAGESLPMATRHFQTSLNVFLGENPFVNASLFDKLKRSRKKKLTSSELKECAWDISKRAGLSDASFGLLVQMVQLLPQETWTARHLHEQLGIKIDDPRLEPLFQSGIVSHVKNTQRYRVDAGIYKLLKNPSQPNVPPTQPTGSQPPSPPHNGIQWR